jgi:hypothetical protein
MVKLKTKQQLTIEDITPLIRPVYRFGYIQPSAYKPPSYFALYGGAHIL